jgi:hypothetical protein
MAKSLYETELPCLSVFKEHVACAKGLTDDGLAAFRQITEKVADSCITKASL